MDKGILSIKIMILGAVIFLAGWKHALDGSLAATLAFMYDSRSCGYAGRTADRKSKRNGKG